MRFQGKQRAEPGSTEGEWGRRVSKGGLAGESREEGPRGADRGCNLECIFPNKLEPAGVEANSCGCGKERTGKTSGDHWKHPSGPDMRAGPRLVCKEAFTLEYPRSAQSERWLPDVGHFNSDDCPK